MNRLVLLPGLDGTGRLFAPFVEALGATLPSRILAYPDRPALSVDQLARWVLDQVVDEGPFFLLGESFSGPIAIRVARALGERVRGLILCCTFAVSPSRMLKRFAWALPAEPFGSPPFSWIRPLLIAGASAPVERRVRDVVQGLSPALVSARLREVARVDVRADLAQLQQPLLGLSATRDRLVPQRAQAVLQALQPSARWVQVDGPHGLLQVNPMGAAIPVQQFIHEVSLDLNRHRA